MDKENYENECQRWTNTLIIVSGNAEKDVINEKAALNFANESGQELHWYLVYDRHRQQHLMDGELKLWLQMLHSGTTRQQLGRIPLCIGMPVLVSQNYDVEGGIVNGSCGVVKNIWFWVDDPGSRYLKSCVLEIPGVTTLCMPHLLPNEFPILADVQDVKFIHPYSKKTCTIKCTQVPIVPAFAVTAHRAQGQTMEQVIVDLESCRGTEAPYVMLSRASSLDGLLVLRPFQPQKITCWLSQDTRNEFHRLSVLNLLMQLDYGLQLQVQMAQEKLANLGIAPTLHIPLQDPIKGSEDAATRLTHWQDSPFSLATPTPTNVHGLGESGDHHLGASGRIV